MNATFADIHAAADYIGPGAIEVPLYQTEIFDICRRSSPFGQRIKQVPATGHPSRFFEETAIPNPGTAGFVNPRSISPTVVSPTRVELSVPLKAIVAQINYNLFDIELGDQQKQFAYLQAKDLVDTVSGVMVAHDVALWNGNDTSLSTPTTTQYMGAAAQIAGRRQLGDRDHIDEDRGHDQDHGCADGGQQRLPCAAHGDLCQPGAAGPDRPGDEDRVQRGAEHRPDHRRLPREDAFDAGRRSASDSRLEPAAYTGTPGSGTAVLPAYIVTEDLIEYHWLGDPTPRIFQLGLPNSLTYQYVAVKFGAPVVKGANYAHYQVLVDR